MQTAFFVSYRQYSNVRFEPARKQRDAFRRVGLGSICYRESPFVRAMIGTAAEAGGVAAASDGASFIVGSARIDNLHEFAEVPRPSSVRNAADDFTALLRAYRREGSEVLAALQGDFSFVLWDGQEERLFFGRDWLGLRRLFYTRDRQGVCVASDAGLLGRGNAAYDRHFIADYLSHSGEVSQEHSPWANVQPVGPGTLVEVRSNYFNICECRSVFTVPQGAPSKIADVEAEFRALFDAGLTSIAETAPAPWCHLSGGLDSSSIVVSLADRDCPVLGLGGTVTWEDDLHPESQAPYIEAVLDRLGCPSIKLRNYGAWDDDGEPPSLSDEPRPHQLFWARHRATRAAVRRGGGGTILGGDGADQFLGNLGWQVAALYHTRSFSHLFRECFQNAIRRQTSLWHQLYRTVLIPLLPVALASRVRPIRDRLPPWLNESLARDTDLLARVVNGRRTRITDGREGVSHRQDRIRRSLLRIRSVLELQPYTDNVTQAFPFLYTPLLQFCLGLPPETGIAMGHSKWLLRAALGDRLPRIVRERATKTTGVYRFVRSLRDRATLIQTILADPLVAQFGWVEADLLKSEVDRSQRGMHVDNAALQTVLSLETWLRISHRAWPNI